MILTDNKTAVSIFLISIAVFYGYICFRLSFVIIIASLIAYSVATSIWVITIITGILNMAANWMC